VAGAAALGAACPPIASDRRRASEGAAAPLSPVFWSAKTSVKSYDSWRRAKGLALRHNGRSHVLHRLPPHLCCSLQR